MICPLAVTVWITAREHSRLLGRLPVISTGFILDDEFACEVKIRLGTTSEVGAFHARIGIGHGTGYSSCVLVMDGPGAKECVQSGKAQSFVRINSTNSTRHDPNQCRDGITKDTI